MPIAIAIYPSRENNQTTTSSARVVGLVGADLPARHSCRSMGCVRSLVPTG